MGLSVPTAVGVAPPMTPYRQHQEEAAREQARSNSTLLLICSGFAATALLGIVLANPGMTIVCLLFCVALPIGAMFEDRKRRAQAISRDDEAKACAVAEKEAAERRRAIVPNLAETLIAEFAADAPRVAAERAEAAWAAGQMVEAFNLYRAGQLAEQKLRARGA